MPSSEMLNKLFWWHGLCVEEVVRDVTLQVSNLFFIDNEAAFGGSNQRTRKMDKNNTETLEQTPDADLYGKVMGIVRNQPQLDAFIEQLGTEAAGKVTALRGAEGTEQLENWKDSLAKYFFGEMEMKMLQLYLDAIAVDLMVFAVDVDFDSADTTAELAKAHGAVDVVYFGNSAITNY